MTTQPMRMIRIALWGLVALALVAVLAVKFGLPWLNDVLAQELGEGDYRLTATDGSVFTEDNLHGEPTAVFFGFTHCPEVCPTTLSDIDVWQEELTERGEDRLRVYFITVDPERGTEEMLGDYVSWVPGVTGVTGSPEEIDKAIKAFRIYAKKVPLEDGGYTMDHSANVLLFDEDGHLFEPIGYQEDYDRVISKIMRLLG